MHVAAVPHGTHPNPWWDIKHYSKTYVLNLNFILNEILPYFFTHSLTPIMMTCQPHAFRIYHYYYSFSPSFVTIQVFFRCNTFLFHATCQRLSRRKRNVNGVEPACETRHLYISPKAALSDKNQWKYIVNVQERDPRVKQIVRAEICRYCTRQRANKYVPLRDRKSVV